MGLTPTSPSGSSPGGGVTVLSYVPFTSSVAVTGTSEAAPTTVVTAGAITATGTTLICVEFYAPWVDVGTTAGDFCFIGLRQDGASIGHLALFGGGASGVDYPVPVSVRRYLTPAAGSHTYVIAAWRGTTAQITAGPGGASSDMPGYIRITSGS
jgi:hypothetical protein